MLRYLTAGLVQNIRPFTGPLHEKLCLGGDFLNVYTSINVILIALSSNLVRFTFICVHKSMPPINDDFISFNIYVTILVLSLLLTSTKFYIGHVRNHISTICIGQKVEMNAINPGINIPAAAAAALLAISIQFLTTLYMKKAKIKTQVVPFGSHANSTNLGSLAITLFINVSSALLAVTAFCIKM